MTSDSEYTTNTSERPSSICRVTQCRFRYAKMRLTTVFAVVYRSHESFTNVRNDTSSRHSRDCLCVDAITTDISERSSSYSSAPPKFAPTAIVSARRCDLVQ